MEYTIDLMTSDFKHVICKGTKQNTISILLNAIYFFVTLRAILFQSLI